MWIRLLNHWNLYRSYMYTMQLTKQIHILQSNYLWSKSFPKYKIIYKFSLDKSRRKYPKVHNTYYIH